MVGIDAWSLEEGGGPWYNGDELARHTDVSWAPEHRSLFAKYTRTIGKSLSLDLFTRYRRSSLDFDRSARHAVSTYANGSFSLYDLVFGFECPIDDRFAHKAIEKGADGLIAVAAGAGGHASVLSPFALIAEIRDWFDGPLALSGSISTGGAVLAAQAMGADFAYIGSPFIAMAESRATDAYKEAICAGRAGDMILPGTTKIGLGLLWIAALLTLYTGWDYLKTGWTHFSEPE